MVGAGALLSLGLLPRPAAGALAASLIPTTLAGHPFWKREGAERQRQLTQFLKNLAALGGLLLVAAGSDPATDPPLRWAPGRHMGRRYAGGDGGVATRGGDRGRRVGPAPSLRRGRPRALIGRGAPRGAPAPMGAGRSVCMVGRAGQRARPVRRPVGGGRIAVGTVIAPPFPTPPEGERAC